MKNIKFFHIGQFFTLRAFLATIIGAGLVVVTEFLLPMYGILQVPAIQSFITPTTITFTLAVLLIFSAIAKNFVSSLFLALAAILSMWSPYESEIFHIGFWAVLVIYLVTALFAGFFATIEISGRTSLLLIGIIFGLQGFIGAGTSMFLGLTNMQQPFLDNNIGVAYSGFVGTFPLYDVIVAGFSFIFMIVFIILSRRRFSIEVQNKTREIVGQIIIFLAMVAPLVFVALTGTIFNQSTAVLIFGDKNAVFMNIIFAKSVAGSFTAFRLLNVFYILPIVGFAIGIGMMFITYGRAEGTTGYFRMNFEGSYMILNLAPFLLTVFYSYPVQRFLAGDPAVNPVTPIYLEMPAWFTVYSEFTNLILINLVAAYVIFKIISLVKLLIKKK
jgi:hypothetical protein